MDCVWVAMRKPTGILVERVSVEVIGNQSLTRWKVYETNSICSCRCTYGDEMGQAY